MQFKKTGEEKWFEDSVTVEVFDLNQPIEDLRAEAEAKEDARQREYELSQANGEDDTCPHEEVD